MKKTKTAPIKYYWLLYFDAHNVNRTYKPTDSFRRSYTARYINMIAHERFSWPGDQLSSILCYTPWNAYKRTPTALVACVSNSGIIHGT